MLSLILLCLAQEPENFVIMPVSTNKYDGKKILRIPPIGSKSNFHGSYSDKECMSIAYNEADIIITNPPFSKFEHFFKVKSKIN